MPGLQHLLVPVLTLAAAAGWASAQTPAYDPLSVPPALRAETLERSFTDDSRQREIPLKIYLPEEASPAPVVLFSHGLGGSRDGNPYLGKHWSARGYVVVFLQHAGSDSAVWQGAKLRERLSALQQAANLQNSILRFQDVAAVINQLEKWNATADDALHERCDLSHVGMSGHSFGAVTTQGVSGQKTTLGRTSYTDPRIQAALAMSPSVPGNIASPERLFGDVQIPWMLMTGTRDDSPIGKATATSRLAVFPALPPHDKYELVLKDAAHDAFSDRSLPGNRGSRNPNHHRVILAVSTAFWDTYLKQDPAAREWLTGDGPAQVLESGDTWRKK